MAHLAFVAFTVLKPAVKEPQKSLMRLLMDGVVDHLSYTRVTAAAVTTGAVYLGYRLIRRRKVDGLIVSVDPMMTSPEGAVPGSPILEGGRLPAGQVKLAIKRGNELMIVGSGLRMEDHLITPTHNVMSGHDLYMITERDRIRIDTANELMLAADVSAFPVPETSWALAGIARIKMAPLAAEKTVTVTSGCDQTYTIGRLRSTQPLGRVHYLASTKPGYSGSAYMDGQSCVGMHNHGGAMAGGYEVLYLWCRLKHALQQIPESSEDFMRRLSKKKRLQFEDLDQDYSLVRQKSGHYHLASRDLRRQLQELREANRRNPGNWAEEAEEQQIRQELAARREQNQRHANQSDSDDEDNYRGYQREDDDSEDEYYEYTPQSGAAVFQGEAQRPATAPRRSARQGPVNNGNRSHVVSSAQGNNAQPQPTGQQPPIPRAQLPLSLLPAILREQSRRAGMSRQEAQRMSDQFLAGWNQRLSQPSTSTAQQTPQPAPSARASTAN